MKLNPLEPCPCASGQLYKACCQPLHKGAAPPTPERLMRSRYSAYKLGLTDYIMSTTHPDGPHYQANRAQWKREIEAFCRTTQFVHLDVLSAVGDSVLFRATLFAGTRDVSFTEISLFRQHNGRWKYHSGTQTP